MRCHCRDPGGDGGERGTVPRHGAGRHSQEDVEPDGEAFLLHPGQAHERGLLHPGAGLLGRHDAQHGQGDAI